MSPVTRLAASASASATAIATATKMAMDKTMLGAEQISFPMLIGTWSWGDTQTWGYKADDLAGIQEAWDACNAVGLTGYDSAEIYGYGESERIIGRLLAKTDEETRKKIYIATKYTLPIPRPGNWFLFTPGVVKGCRNSLERLGVSQVDLYQIHMPFSPYSFRSTAKQLAQCVHLGLAKQVGVSNHSLKEMQAMQKALEAEGVKLASNQVEFSLLRQMPIKNGMLEWMKENGVTLLGYSPLAMGRLTGKYSKDNPVPGGRRFGDYSWDDIEPLLDEMRGLATKYDVSVSAIALNWVISMGAVPLGGARNARQAEQNAKAASFRLTEEEMQSLASKGKDGKTDFFQHG